MAESESDWRIGDEVMEVEALDTLVRWPRHRAISTAMLSWLVMRLKQTLPQFVDEVQIRVIVVRYLGAYPAIGLRYREHSDEKFLEEASATIRRKADELAANALMLDFAEFASRSEQPWEEVWSKLLETE